MTHSVAVKICGIKTMEALNAACGAGAQFIGFVFYPTSSRFIEPDQAWELVRQVPVGVQSVGLFVNPTDRDLETILGRVPLDMVQLHGDETPQRVDEVRLKTELPVIKALPILGARDVMKATEYEDVADWLLFDAKAPAGQYGGTGKSFDWSLLAEQKFKKPWMLSGGLNVDNVKDALKILEPTAVDVSSGVESERGVKDPIKIKAFIEAVKAL
jgi:phosphoribosylanthranilate isomerase